MKTERLILSFIAAMIGLMVAGGGFYLYQMTKTIPNIKTPTIARTLPTPTPDKANFLVVTSPKEEDVVDRKTITISGQTSPQAVITISTEIGDQVVKPAQNGNFSVTQTIDSGVNIVQITAIFPNGDEQKIIRSVTYATEDF